MKRIIMIISPKEFRDEEYFQSKVILQSKGIAVSTASIGKIEEATGILGGKARPDIDITDITHAEFDGIFFVGGEGALTFKNNHQILNLIKKFKDNQLVVGAMSQAIELLIDAKIINKDIIESFNLDKNVATYNNIVICNNHELSLKFGEVFTELINK